MSERTYLKTTTPLKSSAAAMNHPDKIPSKSKNENLDDTPRDNPFIKSRSENRSPGKSRRMRLMERRGMFGALPPGVEISRAIKIDDLLDAYRLVHDSYIETGYISPHPFGIRLRIFETMPETATFIAKADGRIVGVTTAVIDSPKLGVPADKVFKKEIDEQRRNGLHPCEGTNWVIAHEYRSTNIMPELMRVCFAHSLATGCNGMLANVSPGHQPFYNILCFDNIGSERSSSPDIDDPVVLQLNDYRNFFPRMTACQPGEDSDDAVVNRFFITDNPYIEKVKFWASLAEPAFLTPTLLHELFVEKSNYLADCNEKELNIIRQHWGDDLYQEVFQNSAAVSA